MKKILTSIFEYVFSILLLLAICWLLLQILPGNVHLDEYQTIQVVDDHRYTHSWVDPQLSIFQALSRGLWTTFQMGMISLILSYIFSFLFVWLFQVSNHFIRQWILQTSMIFISLPTLFLAPILIYFFAFYFNLLPAGELLHWSGYLMPIFVLMLRPTIHLFRLLRSQLLEIQSEQFVIVAKAKGLSQSQIFFRHLLPHLVIPVITYSPQMIISIVSGSFVVETLFAVPGAGFYLIKAMETRDYPVILSYILLWGGLLLFLSRLAELLIHFIDPRRLREVHQ